MGAIWGTIRKIGSNFGSNRKNWEQFWEQLRKLGAILGAFKKVGSN